MMTLISLAIRRIDENEILVYSGEHWTYGIGKDLPGAMADLVSRCKGILSDYQNTPNANPEHAFRMKRLERLVSLS